MTDQSDRARVTFEEFRHIVARELQLDPDQVARDASFTEDLRADSIQLVNLLLRLEESGVSIPLETAWEVETVGDAYRLYQEQVAPEA